MQARNKFASKGSISLYHAVPEDKTNVWRKMARARNSGLIWYNEVFENMETDLFREQAYLPDPIARNISITVEVIYKTFFPVAQANDWRLIKTVPGSTDQLVRRDFPPSPNVSLRADACSVPGSIIIVLQDNTCLYGFGWNAHIAFRSEREMIRLNKGDVVMFRGDFIYSLVGYETTNVFLHDYLDVPSYHRKELHEPELVPFVDNSRRLDDRFCYAWGCNYLGSGPPCVRKHLNRFHGFCFQEPSNSP